MATPQDNLHYNTRKIDGYNVPFNFIISEREAGKSTYIWLNKCYKAWKEKGETTLVIRRKVVHITNSYINDISKIINKFTDDNVHFKFASSSIKDGIVDVFIDNQIFIRVVGLSADITAVKSLVLENLRYIVFDEFICNTRFGEKYLKDESTKFMEVYNTFRRESENLKCYFMGNPYSLYNPYFIFFNIPTSKLIRGTIFSDNKSYVVECYEMKQELREKILQENPLYQFDNSYTKYAFNGLNVNDVNIRLLAKKPENFALLQVFKISGKYLALSMSQTFYDDEDILYYVEFISPQEVSRRRNIYCFDFEELVEHTALLSPDERYKFSRIKSAMRRRYIAFNNIECYYLFEEIYFNL